MMDSWDDKMWPYILNLAIVSLRLEALRFFRPYVSRKVQSLSTSCLRTLQLLNFISIAYYFFFEEYVEEFADLKALKEEGVTECGAPRYPYKPMVLIVCHIVVTAWFFVFKGLN